MHFNLIALVLPVLALGRAAFASPVEHDASAKAVDISDYSKLNAATKFTPKASSEIKLPSTGLTFTTENTGFHALNKDSGPALIVCTEQDCDGDCFWIYLPACENSCCDTPFGFMSGMVDSPGNLGLPYGVFVGLEDCDLPVQLPVVNTCYNLFYDGEPYDFSTFYLNV